MQKKFMVWNAAQGTLFGWIVDENNQLVFAAGYPGVTDRQEVEALAKAEGAELHIREGEA